MKTRIDAASFLNFVPILLICFALLNSCTNQSDYSVIETEIPENYSDQLNSSEILPFQSDKQVAIYHYLGQDSTLTGQIWYLHDSIVKEEGKTNFQIPLQFEIWDGLIAKADGKRELETFTENICEVGGNSAWNKYRFTYDSLQRPLTVEHYKAWWYEGLYDEEAETETERPDNPEYFHTRTIQYIYENNITQEIVKSLEYEFTERVTKIVDDQKRLVLEIYQSQDQKKKYFYTYSN